MGHFDIYIYFACFVSFLETWRKMKKYLAVWGALFFFVICISLYLMMETVNTSPGRFPDIDRVNCYLLISVNTSPGRFPDIDRVRRYLLISVNTSPGRFPDIDRVNCYLLISVNTSPG